MFPGSRWAIIRNDLPTIRRNVLPTFEKLKPIPFVGNVNKNDWTARCSNGSEIIFMTEAIREDPELNRWRGLEVNGFLFEEVNEVTRTCWNKGIERAGTWRVPGEGPQPPILLLATCNPTQSWVKDLFYNPWASETLKEPYFYLPARADDNPYISQEQRDSWGNLPEMEFKMFVEGSWDVDDSSNQLVPWSVIDACRDEIDSHSCAECGEALGAHDLEGPGARTPVENDSHALDRGESYERYNGGSRDNCNDNVIDVGHAKGAEREKSHLMESTDEPPQNKINKRALYCHGFTPQDIHPSLGADVAHFGPDKSIIVRMNGPNIAENYKWDRTAINEMVQHILRIGTEHQVEAKHVGVDGVGLGAGVIDYLKNLNSYRVKNLRGGDKPVLMRKRTLFEFFNLRAQMAWILKEDMEAGLIGGVVDQHMRADIGAIQYSVTNDRKIKIESKLDMKKRIGRSPDYFDALMYANWVRRIRTPKPSLSFV